MVSIAKMFKGKYEAQLEIPGVLEGPNQKANLGGGMNIFCDHTFHQTHGTSVSGLIWSPTTTLLLKK